MKILNIFNFNRLLFIIFLIAIFLSLLSRNSPIVFFLNRIFADFLSNHNFNIVELSQSLTSKGLPPLASDQGEAFFKLVLTPVKKFILFISLGLSFFEIINYYLKFRQNDISDKKILLILVLLSTFLAPPFSPPFGISSMGLGFASMSLEPLSTFHPWYQNKITLPFIANLIGLYGVLYYFFWIFIYFFTTYFYISLARIYTGSQNLIFFSVFSLGILSIPAVREYSFTPGYVDLYIAPFMIWYLMQPYKFANSSTSLSLGFLLLLTHDIAAPFLMFAALYKRDVLNFSISIFYLGCLILFQHNPYEFFQLRIQGGTPSFSINLLSEPHSLIHLIEYGILSLSFFILFVPKFLMWIYSSKDKSKYYLLLLFIMPYVLIFYFADVTRILGYSLIPLLYWLISLSTVNKKFIYSVSLLTIFSPHFHYVTGGKLEFQNGLIDILYSHIFSL